MSLLHSECLILSVFRLIFIGRMARCCSMMALFKWYFVDGFDGMSSYFAVGRTISNRGSFLERMSRSVVFCGWVKCISSFYFIGWLVKYVIV